MEQNTGFKEMFLRLVAIVGLIAVLILGAWGIILLAFNLVGLFSGTVHWSDIFSHPTTTTTQEVATTTQQVVVVQPANGNTTTSKPATTSGATTAVYTAAPRTTQLYGLADLAVTITSVTSLSSVQGRTVVSFTVSNVGTNMAPAGWSFNALLPYQGSTYTYQSQTQQALYPGDSIAYTLTYDNAGYNNNYNYNNQVCSQQYPYTCTYNYSNQYPYNTYNTQPQTCYTYNGYQNIPGPCLDSNGNTIYNYNTGYNNQYPYNTNYNYYNTNSYGYSGTVTITVDPQHWVAETNEYNNTASKNF